jgi:iron complex outermembrane recepter protein
MGSVSLLSLLNVVAAEGQTAPAQTAEANPEAVPEQVLITGSLIHGAAAVGVPVVGLTPQDFLNTGQITIGALLAKVPSVQINQLEQASTNGNITRNTALTLHQLGGTRNLLLVDGMRAPLDSYDGSVVDANIIPQLALDRIDVLADGASATYGSDAIGGVVNEILKRGYDGAETMVRIGGAASAYGGGDFTWLASQLYGRTWTGGDITITYENSGANALATTAKRLKYQYTQDYSPWGLDNENPITSATPGIVSTGKPSASTGSICTNCYSIPVGSGANFNPINGGIGPTAPGSGGTLTWAQLLANQGVLNQHNSFDVGQLTAPVQTNAAAVTFDQNIFPGVSLFVDGYYHNRRFKYETQATGTGKNQQQTFSILTTNPYYPVGAPAGLQVSVDLTYADPQFLTGGSVEKRLDGGFNIDLPAQWNLRLFTSFSETTPYALESNIINDNAANAALGNTIAAQPQSGNLPPLGSYTKPSNIPYLNVFCDQIAFKNCNSPLTLAYMSGLRHYTTNNNIRENAANFDGPLFDLPAGTLRAAVGGEATAYDFTETAQNSYSSDTPGILNSLTSAFTRTVYSAYTQINVPVFGGNFTLPFVESLNLEGSYRYDHYSDFGSVSSPKAAINWTLGAGFTVKLDWGKSFRAPFVQELLSTASTVHATNILGGDTRNTTPLCATVGGTPTPGSTAAILNPTCSAALQYQGGISFSGAPVAGIRPADGLPATLQPEKATNTSFGVEFAPTYSFLKGLDVQVTDWRVYITNYLASGLGSSTATVLNSPLYASTVITKSNPNFAQYVQLLVSNVGSNVPLSAVSNITWIQDGSFLNSGWLKLNGIDYQASYDIDLGDYGAFNIGTTGTYYLQDQTQILPGGPISDVIRFNGVTFGTEIPVWVSRSRLGWATGAYSFTLFWNHTSHFQNEQPFPPAQYLAAFPNYSDKEPAFESFDLVVGYNTGDLPANTYLKNIGITLNVNDLFDKHAPFEYNISSGGNSAVAFVNSSNESYIGRFISIAIDKRW